MVPDETLEAKPINDTILLSMSFTLPGNFAYLLNEVHVNILGDTADDWEPKGILLLGSPSPQLKGFIYRMSLPFLEINNSGTTAGLGRATQIGSGFLSRVPILPGREGAFSSLRFSNLAAAAGAAGLVNMLVSFWEYDLEQMQYFAAHSAANVVGR